jgi:hypothetical protein
MVAVPGTVAVATGGFASLSSVSCASAGNCSAGGYYGDGSGHAQAFVVNEDRGVWHTAVEVPGTAALNTGRDAGVSSVSCVRGGNCSAGGSYTDGSDHEQAFVVNEKGGVWRTAAEVLGTAALNTSGYAKVNSVSCGSAGNCAAGGYYINGSGWQAFVVDEKGGVWQNATEVPGTAALNTAGYAAVNAVSCAPAGDCSAGGDYKNGVGLEAFVVNQS